MFAKKTFTVPFNGVILSGFTFESPSRLEERTYNGGQN